MSYFLCWLCTVIGYTYHIYNGTHPVFHVHFYSQGSVQCLPTGCWHSWIEISSVYGVTLAKHGSQLRMEDSIHFTLVIVSYLYFRCQLCFCLQYVTFRSTGLICVWPQNICRRQDQVRFCDFSNCSYLLILFLVSNLFSLSWPTKVPNLWTSNTIKTINVSRVYSLISQHATF